MNTSLRRAFTETTASDTPPADTPPASDTPAPTPTADPKPAETPDLGSRVETLEAELKRARDEAASRRVALREEKSEFENFKKGLAGALGLGGDEGSDKPDPSTLASTVEELRKENRDLKVKTAFSEAAREVGADESLSWAVLRSSDLVTGLNVESEESLKGSLVEYLKAAIEENPKLKSEPGAPTKSGTDIGGGSAPTTFTRDEIRRMNPDEIEANWSTISEQMKAGKIR